MFTLLLERTLTHAERGDGLSHYMWLTGWTLLSMSLQRTPNWGELEGRATIQSELNNLEVRPSNLHEVQKRQMHSLEWGTDQPRESLWRRNWPAGQQLCRKQPWSPHGWVNDLSLESPSLNFCTVLPSNKLAAKPSYIYNALFALLHHPNVAGN